MNVSNGRGRQYRVDTAPRGPVIPAMVWFVPLLAWQYVCMAYAAEAFLPWLARGHVGHTTSDVSLQIQSRFQLDHSSYVEFRD